MREFLDSVCNKAPNNSNLTSHATLGLWMMANHLVNGMGGDMYAKAAVLGNFIILLPLNDLISLGAEELAELQMAGVLKDIAARVAVDYPSSLE